MKRLHVGYVLKVYPRLSETFIVNEILELERRGVDVTVFSLRLPSEGRFHGKLARVRAEVVYLPDRTPADLWESFARRREEFAPVRGALGALLWEELDREPSPRAFGKSLELASEARRRGIHHLHAHFATSAADAARFASRLTGISYSFTAHAKDIYHDEASPDALRRRMVDAAFVVTVCDANRAHLQGLGADGVRVHRIYNGLDLDEYGYSPRIRSGPFRVLGVGRLVRKKGFDVLVDAARLLRDRGIAFECRLAGDGTERDALAARIREARLEDFVRMLGALPVERVHDEMSQADVVVLPARVDDEGNRDALPTVLLEAMAIGRPFVSTPVTGIPEISGAEEAGRLVPCNNPASLADALAQIASDEPAARALGRAGRLRAERIFDVKRNVADLHDLFARSVMEAAACVSST